MTEIKYEVTVNERGTFWRLNGKYHREDGPAIENDNGCKTWWLNGEPHRENGPAAEFSNGTKGWYLNGENYTESEFKKEMAKRNKPTCEGKVVEIDGKKYKLTQL
jgi:hypothetical protein